MKYNVNIGRNHSLCENIHDLFLFWEQYYSEIPFVFSLDI